MALTHDSLATTCPHCEGRTVVLTAGEKTKAREREESIAVLV